MGRQIHIISDQLAAELELPQRKCRLFIQRLLEEIQDDIVHTARLEFRGLGTFSVTVRPAHTTQHPVTGQPVHIAAKKTVRYRSSKALRDRLNPKD
jgi:DNA-binding protein HU-beta